MRVNNLDVASVATKIRAFLLTTVDQKIVIRNKRMNSSYILMTFKKTKAFRFIGINVRRLYLSICVVFKYIDIK